MRETGGDGIKIKDKKLAALFIGVTLLWTWMLLGIPALLHLTEENSVTRGALILAGASPSVLGLLFAALSRDKPALDKLSLSKTYISTFLGRVIRFGRIGAARLIAVFTLVPAVTVASAYAYSLVTSTPPDWSYLAARLNDPLGLLLFAVFTLVFGPLAEELGWRGYLLDRLKDGSALVWGIGIGFIWTIWHAPLFFIEGTYQSGLLALGIWPVVNFILSTTALGVIIGDIARRSGSILAAVLFHFTINFTGELVPLRLEADLIATAVYMVIAAGIILRDARIRRGEPIAAEN